MEKSYAEIALEVFESVKRSNNREKRLLSSTLWRRFRVKRRTRNSIEKVRDVLSRQGLNITVKSGAPFGEEDDDDWISLTASFTPPPPFPIECPVQRPSADWLKMISAREFESEREVEAYFLVPLLEQLGYQIDDIVIGFPVGMFKGVQKTVKEADIVIFDGPTREKKDVLLLMEAKKTDKDISLDHIGQARSYAQELLPACYLVSNGHQLKVFQFNGMLLPDECVMDFNRLELAEKWDTFYQYISKEASTRRKEWMKEQLQKARDEISRPGGRV